MANIKSAPMQFGADFQRNSTKKLCPRRDLSTYDTTRDVSTESLSTPLPAGEGVISCLAATSKGATRPPARGRVPFIPLVQHALIPLATRMNYRLLGSAGLDRRLVLFGALSFRK